jgi:hypothetical protein
MDQDKLAFLSGGTDDTAPAPEAHATPEAPAPEPEDAGGTPAAREAPAPTSQPPLTEKETVGFFKAMQAEREKRQALEKELEGYRASAAAKAAEDEPDPIQTMRAQLHQERMERSRAFADQKFGADAMTAVHDWAVARCDADPHFNSQVFQSRDPYAFAKAAYDKERVLQAVKPDELDDYAAWKASRATPTPTPPPQPPPPPRSLATQPNAGGAGRPEVPMGPGAAFGAAIR